jgi:hypothetical protein
MNRITTVIQNYRNVIEQKNLDQTKLDTLSQQLNMNLEEYVMLQERKSLACASGRLSLEEAQVVYGYLGESVETFNAQPLEVKIVLNQLLKELIQAA